MNKNFYRWLAGAMCAAALCLGAQSAQAQVENVDDYVYIEDFSIAPGQTVPLTVWMNNECTWSTVSIYCDLPEGLVLEKLDREQLDEESFTTDYFSNVGNANDYVALSNEFVDQDYMDEEYMSELEYQRKWFDEGLRTLAVVDCDPALAFTMIYNDRIGQHYGIYPLYQLSVRATGDLAEESVITTRMAMLGTQDLYIGQEVDNQLNGQPRETRVRRVTTTAVTDIEAAPVLTGNGVYYNMMGQPVADPAPGIYIRDGRKVLVR